ncbi:hypothetical protein ACP0HM_25360 [Escherichia coli]
MMTLATALFCRLLLRGWGYNVALANSGRQALEQVRERVFLILCFAMCEWRRWTALPR